MQTTPQIKAAKIMCGCHDTHQLFSSEMNTVDGRLSVKSKQQDNYIASSFKVVDLGWFCFRTLILFLNSNGLVVIVDVLF